MRGLGVFVPGLAADDVVVDAKGMERRRHRPSSAGLAEAEAESGVFGSGPGSGAYDNLVEHNYIAGNGLAGVTLHAHHPGGEDINGNDIIGNWIGKNNLAGDAFDGGISNFQKTGIAVYSVPSVHMAIRHNVIRHNQIGVWLTSTVDAEGLRSNSYRDTLMRVVVQPPN